MESIIIPDSVTNIEPAAFFGGISVIFYGGTEEEWALISGSQTIPNKITVYYSHPNGHEYSERWTIDKEATITEEGLKSHCCTICGEKIDITVVPKLVDSSKQFTDIQAGAWYKNAIDYSVSHGLMNGVGDTEFAPNETMNRAMLVMVLYRMEGEPSVAQNSPFTDLKQNWYKDSVAWAYENGVVNGTSDTTFAPTENITRE